MEKERPNDTRSVIRKKEKKENRRKEKAYILFDVSGHSSLLAFVLGLFLYISFSCFFAYIIHLFL